MLRGEGMGDIHLKEPLYKIGETVFACITEGENGKGKVKFVMIGKVIGHRLLNRLGIYQYQIVSLGELHSSMGYTSLLNKQHIFHEFWVEEAPFLKTKFIDGLVKGTKLAKAWRKLKSNRLHGEPERVIFT